MSGTDKPLLMAVEDVFTASPETLLDAARLRVLDGL